MMEGISFEEKISLLLYRTKKEEQNCIKRRILQKMLTQV